MLVYSFALEGATKSDVSATAIGDISVPCQWSIYLIDQSDVRLINRTSELSTGTGYHWTVPVINVEIDDYWYVPVINEKRKIFVTHGL